MNLASLAGQSLMFRFRIGTDSIVDDFGWFIDDIRSTAARARCRTQSIDKVKTKKAKSGKQVEGQREGVVQRPRAQIDAGAPVV